MLSIENDFLRISVNDSLGGSLTSIFDKTTNEELQYQPVEGSWNGQDVVIFPFVARLLNGTYSAKGKEYSMKNHGLARYNSFKVAKAEKNVIELEFASSEETLKQYPWNFLLKVTYTLDGRSLKVAYSVTNKDEKEMYFGLGGHPALRIDEDKNNEILGNYVLFPSNTKATLMKLDPTFSFITGEEEEKVLERLEVNRRIFQEKGTLMYKVNDLKECVLVRKNGRKIKYAFSNIDFLAIWTNPSKGDYLCVEPWTSLPDYLDANKEFKNKKTLKHLAPNKTFEMSYMMSF